MGASLSYRIYPASLTRTEVEQKWGNDVETSLYENGHSYSGDIGMLGKSIAKWYDTSEQKDGKYTAREAEEFLEGTHDKWESAIAVAFIKDNVKYWMIGGWCSS